MNDKKFMRAAMVIDAAFAGFVAAFFSVPVALLMVALLVYAAINF